MKEVLLPLAATAAFIIVVGVFVQKSQNQSINIPFLKQTFKSEEGMKEITVGKTKIKVTLADTEAKRVKGLSGTSSLKDNEGMLFIFDKKDVFPAFWMKDMLIPIDIIWINNDQVVKIDKNVQAPEKGTPDSKLTLYRPDYPIDYVLEVKAGFSDKNNLKTGDPTDINNI